MRLRFTRRSVVAATLAVAMTVSMAACRVQQGAAAFVGDARITEKQVDAVVDSVPSKVRTRLALLDRVSGGQYHPIGAGQLRSYVVGVLATIELGRQVSADTNVAPDDSQAEGVDVFWTGPMVQMKPSSRFVKLEKEAESYRNVLFAGAVPAKPTASEVDDIAKRLGKAYGQKLTASDKKSLASSLSGAGGKKALGDLHRVRDHIKQYDVTANPRYGESFIVIHTDPRTVQPDVVATIPS